MARAAGVVLAAVGGRDEAALEEAPAVRRAGEDHVLGLVAHEEGALDVRGRRELHDADAVRQVVHHPDLVVGAGGHRDRLDADLNRAGVGEGAGAVDAEDLEVVVGRVDGEELRLIRRQGQRSHRAALEEEIGGRDGARR